MDSNLQLRRAAFHFLNAIIVICIVQVMRVSTTVLDNVILYVGGTIVALDHLRVLFYHLAASNIWSIFSWIWIAVVDWFESVHFIRKEEAGKLTAGTSYVLGIAVVYFGTVHLLGSPVYIPFMAVIILATGDPVARITGISWRGPTMFRKKTWAGFFGFVVASMSMLMLTNFLTLWYPLYPSCDFVLLRGQFVGCIVGALVEVYAPSNDNFFIPVFAGGIMYLAIVL